MTSIGKYAFQDCTALTAASFPAATSIEYCAFADCTALATASFPAVTQIDPPAFENCEALASLSLPAPPPTVNPQEFDSCPPTRNLTLVDASGAVLTVNAAPAPARTGYNTGSTYTGNEYPGSFAGSTLTVQGDCNRFTSLVVDNVILTQGQDYAVGCGSTVITFTPAFLATLKDGTHTVKVQFTDGRYMGTFTTPFASAAAAVPDVPATNGRPAAFVWFLCGMCCLLAQMGVDRRRD